MLMKKKSGWINWLVIIGVVVIAIFILVKGPKAQTTQEVAECIGKKSTLYVQLGCPHCETQKDMFGGYYKYLDKVDCFYERDKCQDIKGTPTWVINGQQYVGVQSIDRLKTLTGC